MNFRDLMQALNELASRFLIVPVFLVVVVSLTGCSTPYVKPIIDVDEQWRVQLPSDVRSVQLADWWRDFGDSALHQLIDYAQADSPTLDQAAAAIGRARATLGASDSSRYPSANISTSAGRNRQIDPLGNSTLVDVRSTGIDAKWEIDIWGRLKDGERAASATLEARTGEWHFAKISLAAEVADTYIQYRGCQLIVDAYERAIISRDKTNKAVEQSVLHGFTSPSEDALVRAGYATAVSSYYAQQMQCDILMKALVALSGKNEHTIRSLVSDASLNVMPRFTPYAVSTIPADVIRQRPDIIALERGVAAANAQIGVAKAARYPTFTLSGILSSGVTAGTISSNTWSFSSGLSLPIFDGGQRAAALTIAEMDYQTSVAKYRAGVRSAVKEVEQSLVRLGAMTKRETLAVTAFNSYKKSLNASEVMFSVGGLSAIDLEDVRRSVISSEVELINIQQSQGQSLVALYKALGGGWEIDAPQEASSVSDLQK